jgi:hypothetical protein
MGKRLHVVSKQREYGKSEGFNWKFEEFKDFLEDLGADVCAVEDCAEEFECDEYSYKEILDMLKDYKENGITDKVKEFFNEKYKETKFINDLDNLGGLDELIDIMQRFYDERDKNSEWIQFVAF